MKSNIFKKILLVIINLITLSRLLGAIILPFIYYKYGASISAIVTIVLFSTDAIDGYLARTFELSTLFGSAMDAMCDKLLNFTSLTLLAIEYNIMFYPLILEIIILLINYLIYRQGGNVQSSIVGKIKTIFLDVFVILSFVIISLPALKINSHIINHLIHNTGTYIMIFAFICIINQILTVINYTNKLIKTKKDPKIKRIKYQNRKRKTFKEFMEDAFDHNYYLQYKDFPIVRLFYK